MHVLQIEHGVHDFATWKATFDSDPAGREAGGVRSYRILRPLDDPSYVIIELDFETAHEAETFRGRLEAVWSGGAPNLGLRGLRARIVGVAESKTY